MNRILCVWKAKSFEDINLRGFHVIPDFSAFFPLDCTCCTLQWSQNSFSSVYRFDISLYLYNVVCYGSFMPWSLEVSSCVCHVLVTSTMWTTIPLSSESSTALGIKRPRLCKLFRHLADIKALKPHYSAIWQNKQQNYSAEQYYLY